MKTDYKKDKSNSFLGVFLTMSLYKFDKFERERERRGRCFYNRFTSCENAPSSPLIRLLVWVKIYVCNITLFWGDSHCILFLSNLDFYKVFLEPFADPQSFNIPRRHLDGRSHLVSPLPSFLCFFKFFIFLSDFFNFLL